MQIRHCDTKDHDMKIITLAVHQPGNPLFITISVHSMG